MEMSERGDAQVVFLGTMGLPEGEIRDLAAGILGTGFSLRFPALVSVEPEAIIAQAHDADAIIMSNLPFPGSVVRGCPRLRLLSLAFTGTDRIDLAACQAAGVAVCNTPDYSTTAVAEFTLGLLLAVLRHLPEALVAARNGRTWEGLAGGELAGRTVGLVGTGHIGLHMARLLKGFGCSLLGYARRPSEEGESLGIVYTGLDDLLVRSDVVSLHLPLTDQTSHLIDQWRLALMKPSAILVNTARGGLVDNGALADALREGRLAGAGLDTVDVRPPLPRNHPLLAIPNALVTPHMAFATREAFARRSRIALENVAAWRRGQLQNVVAQP